MTPFEEALGSELLRLLRAGVPARGVRLTVREQLVARIERGPLGAREVSEAAEAAVRAACRLVRERDVPGELVETVLRAALEAVRGQGGESARWLDQAAHAAFAVLDEQAQERSADPAWGWLAWRLSREWS